MSSRRANFRNSRKGNEEPRRIEPFQPIANPMVKFNYANPVPVQVIPAPEKTQAPNNQRTVNTMNSMSSFSAK